MNNVEAHEEFSILCFERDIEGIEGLVIDYPFLTQPAEDFIKKHNRQSEKIKELKNDRDSRSTK